MARLFRGSLGDECDPLTGESNTPSWAINGVFHQLPGLELDPGEDIHQRALRENDGSAGTEAGHENAPGSPWNDKPAPDKE